MIFLKKNVDSVNTVNLVCLFFFFFNDYVAARKELI